MGIFSFLFGKKAEPAPPTVTPVSEPAPVPTSIDSNNPSIPTVKLRQTLQDAFVDSFRLHMSSLSGFTADEIEEMVSFVANVPNSCVNNGAWRVPIYNEYFKLREWSWPLLEEWRDTLIARRAYWSFAWLPWYKDDDRAFDTVVRKLKVDEVRSILKQACVPFESKAKKAALIELLKGSVSLEFLEKESNEWKTAMFAVMDEEEESKTDFKYEEYVMLVNHIKTHATNIECMQRFAELGLSFKISPRGGPNMSALAEELHRKNPQMIPPLFPDDRTVLTIDTSSIGK